MKSKIYINFLSGAVIGLAFSWANAYADIPVKPTHFISCESTVNPTWNFNFLYNFHGFDAESRAAEVVVLDDMSVPRDQMVLERFQAPSFDLEAVYSVSGDSFKLLTRHLTIQAGRSGTIELTSVDPEHGIMRLKSTNMHLQYPQGLNVQCLEDILVGPRPTFTGSN